jgi:hypothetical protein
MRNGKTLITAAFLVAMLPSIARGHAGLKP